MSFDLPVARSQPYQSVYPWYDVSSLLTPGLSPFKGDSVLACAAGNDLKITWTISVDRQCPDLKENWLVQSPRLPVGLRPASSAAGTGWFSVSGSEYPYRVELSPSGWVAMPRWPSMGHQLSDFSMIDLSLTVPRGTV